MAKDGRPSTKDGKPSKTGGKRSGKDAKHVRAAFRTALSPHDPAPLSPRAAERYEQGRAERATLPHEAHAGWEPGADRADPVAILERQAQTRVPELVPLRYGRMLASPFAFLRGSAAVMAADLAAMPSAGPRAQCCGDAHLANFGIYAAPDRQPVFDLNDFDETLPAPFEWDVKRLAASFAVAGADNGFRGRDVRAATRAVSHAYRTWMHAFAGARFLDTWYARVNADDIVGIVEGVSATASKTTRKTVDKARTKTSLGALDRFAERVGDSYRIRAAPPVIVRDPDEETPERQELIRGGFEDYLASMDPDRREIVRRYRFVDYARKVVGVGSVGTEAFMFLLMGDRDDDPLFLQLKEAQPSVLAPFAGASEYENDGQRVVVGQRMMQVASDPFLGWLRGRGPAKRAFYLRQLRDMKGSVDVTRLAPAGFEAYGRLCGGVLARAHARTGDAARIAGYVGDDDSFDRAICAFAAAYAEQSVRDHAALEQAERDGSITVQREAV